MDKEQDKPEGTEQHPPGADPARQGGGDDADQGTDAPRPMTEDPLPQGSPGEPGVTSPKK